MHYLTIFRNFCGNRKRRFRIIILLIVLFCYSAILPYVYDQDAGFFESAFFNFRGLFKKSEFRRGYRKATKQQDFLIEQPGCRIPSMSVNGPSDRDYIVKVNDIHCEYREVCSTKGDSTTSVWNPALVKDTNDSLFVDKSALKFYSSKNLNCSYRSFNRLDVNLIRSEDPENVIIYTGKRNLLDIHEPTRIEEEFVEVLCKDDEKMKLVYRDTFAFVPLKKDVEKRCENFEHEENRLSVMIIGLDSVSRLNFHRQMPLSAAYLKNELKAVEMYGYNKVADNTFPNLVPLLTGLDVHELQNLCWLTEDDFFDDCPFVWKMFQENGYRTIYAEDAAALSTFNLFKKGFHTPPTDYYQHPFYLQADLTIAHNRLDTCERCAGSRLYFEVMLDYASKYALTFRDKRYFGFFWSNTLTHDAFNLPSQGDVILLKFLRRLRDDKLLNRTALIMVADHGIRCGEFRQTFQGHLEECLPLLQFVLPEWFEGAYKLATANLRRNARRLTTPFDLHETLLDFVNTTRLQDAQIIERLQKMTYRVRQQSSLFLPIFGDRTCSTIGVPKHYCACYDEARELSREDGEAVRAADALIDHLNTLLADRPECASLRLDSIERATVVASTRDDQFAFNVDDNDSAVSYYIITVVVRPGNAVFEATVEYEQTSRTCIVAGQVSRLNMYGKQSHCVDDPILKLYCYCNDQLDQTTVRAGRNDSDIGPLG